MYGAVITAVGGDIATLGAVTILYGAVITAGCRVVGGIDSWGGDHCTVQ